MTNGREMAPAYAGGGAGDPGSGQAPGHSAGHPAPSQGEVSLAALWFGIFGAPVAWSVQTLVDYPLAAHACFPIMQPLGAPIVGGLWWILLGVSVVTLIIGGAAGLVAWRSWQATLHEAGGGHHRALETGEGRTRFMAMSGVLTSVLFLLVSLVHAAALFLVQPCGA